MATEGAITVTSFSRQERRRMSQAQRTGRGFTPPGQGQPPQRSGGCCIFLILLIVGIVVYAYIDAYVLHPQQKPEQKEKKSSLAPAIVKRMDGPVYDLKLQPSAVQSFVRRFGEVGSSPVREG